ncbi:MAG: diaminopimelate decarboxylase [Chloroflexota bacterium]|nr:diaminopimelate decarboxylase [Chloroflexota bacterium]
MSVLEPLSSLLPDSADVNEQGHLTIGGCDIVELAIDFGTPLYVFDETTLRRTCAEFRESFGQHYDNSAVVYAAKAFINRALAQIIKEEGLGLDVVSGGELSIAKSINFPADSIYLHGNNKLREEIESAVSYKIGYIVIDNLYELSLVNEVAKQAGITQNILLRLSPGIDAHTHRHVATGIIDSKFGLPIASGQAETAIGEAMAASNLNLMGLHMHIGSLIFDAEPYREAIRVVFQFAADMAAKHSFDFREFSSGGGFAIQYTRDTPSSNAAYFAEAIAEAIRANCNTLDLQPPRLTVEPGRAIVGRSGVAVYRAGSIKDIPGIRKYVSVDGGMADNIRPALYDSKYEALVANKVTKDNVERVTIAGKFCESGDILVKDVSVPNIVPGDCIAIPVSGAYCLSLASNYNASLKPAIALVKDGKARLIRRRDTYDDLMGHDVV